MLDYINKKRLRVVLISCLVIFICILAKLFYEQIINHELLLDKANQQWQRDFNISGERGSILDRNGTPLAVNVASQSVIVIPSQIKDKEKTAQQLSEILECDYDKLLDKISKRVNTQKLQPEGRLISNEKAKEIKGLDIAGVYIVKDSKRVYPKKNYLSHVLGFTGIDNQGLGGVELEYDEYLKANNGDIKIPLDAKGNNIHNIDQSYIDSGKGFDVRLSIDTYIQDVIERELDNVMLRYNPKNALALAMDPNNGEILAMASKPDFDPNNYKDYSMELINQNLPIWKNYEPGSTFKTLTFAAGLELKCFDMFKDTYFDRGFEMVGGARIKSWKAGGHGLQTYLQVLENSSNPGFVNISRMLGKDNLYDFIEKYNLTSKTGIDLPGESKGIMFKKENMGELETATVAFGQGISITPIQLCTAFSSIINGGNLYQPHVVKGVYNSVNGDPLYEKDKVLIRKTVSEDTSKKMRYALESVVANGGGKQAYMEGYLIGGKTGTAQKVANGQYMENEYILSFISAAPIDNPKIVLYIAVEAPQNDVQYGGTVVAPIAKKIYEDVLPYLEVKKVDKQIPKMKIWGDPVKIKVKNYIGMNKKDVKQEGLTFEFVGSGDKVLQQLPVENTVIKEGGKVWIYLG